MFLAADKTRLQDLDEAVRRFLAWKSIVDESETLERTQAQARQAAGSLSSRERRRHEGERGLLCYAPPYTTAAREQMTYHRVDAGQVALRGALADICAADVAATDGGHFSSGP